MSGKEHRATVGILKDYDRSLFLHFNFKLKILFQSPQHNAMNPYEREHSDL